MTHVNWNLKFKMTNIFLFEYTQCNTHRERKLKDQSADFHHCQLSIKNIVRIMIQWACFVN